MDQKTCNSSIHCTVENCAYHAPQNCCSLKSINVGCCDSSPTSCKGTECASFQLKDRRPSLFPGKLFATQPPQGAGGTVALSCGCIFSDVPLKWRYPVPCGPHRKGVQLL